MIKNLTTDPAGKSVVNTYDDASRLATRTDRLGRVEIFGYDNAGRLKTEIWQMAGTTVDTKFFNYYDDGRVQSAGDNAGQYTFAYDGDGRVLTQSDTYNGVTLTSVYTAGDRTSLTDSKGGTLVSTFDAKHQLLSRSQSVIGVRVEYS